MYGNTTSIRACEGTILTAELAELNKKPFAFGRLKDEAGHAFTNKVNMDFLNALGYDPCCSDFTYCENYLLVENDMN